MTYETESLHDLIDRYWDIAWKEGRENRHHDTRDGKAQKCLSEINQKIESLNMSEAQARISELSNLCERLQGCAQGFYLDQGDHGYMEAIMKDYHWIMRASKPWRDAYVKRLKAETLRSASMRFGGRDFEYVRGALKEWAESLDKEAQVD